MGQTLFRPLEREQDMTKLNLRLHVLVKLNVAQMIIAGAFVCTWPGQQAPPPTAFPPSFQLEQQRADQAARVARRMVEMLRS
jgi:hypothetical protein